MKNIAVILAGGDGTRIGQKIPKQFLKLAGRMVIEHTIDSFQNHKLIDEIAIVTNSHFTDLVEELVNKNKYSKVKRILNGGKTRNESSLSAINAYWNKVKNNDLNLIFHDAVRPFVSDTIINDTVKALSKFNAVDVAIPTADTIIKIKDSGIDNIPKRSELMRGQTPQGFRINTIKKAYDLAQKDSDFQSTDDCSVVLKYLPDEKIFVVEGDELNIKITYELDLFIADKLFQIKRTSTEGHDSNLKLLKDKTVIIFGGSYGIGKEIFKICNKNGANVYSFSRSENNTDVKNAEDIRKALLSIYRKTRKIDYVINTAAVLKKETLVNMDYGDISDIINVNLTGCVNIAKESFNYLKKTNGSLLFFTSSSYSRGRAFYSLYSSTKSAVVNLTQALSEEWHPFDIRVNCINPERTKTPMRLKNFGIEPQGTLLDPKLVALESVKTFLSDLTGQIVYIKKNNKK